MGTINNPGKYDCISKADPEEPFFVLLGRDPMAPKIVEAWIKLRHLAGEDIEKLNEATKVVADMRAWLEKVGRKEIQAEVKLVGPHIPISHFKNPV